MHRHHQALTPSLYGLAAQTARRSFGLDAVEHRCAGIPHSHADLGSDFVHADTNQTHYNTNFTHFEAPGPLCRARGRGGCL